MNKKRYKALTLYTEDYEVLKQLAAKTHRSLAGMLRHLILSEAAQ